jgi:DNA-binding SARP family transcriptional activator
VLALAGPPHVTVDLTEFELLLDRAGDADRRGVPSEAAELLATALQMWRGPCLVEIECSDWAQPTCDRVTGRYVAAAVRLAELRLAAGDSLMARRLARHALAADEWSEAAHRVLIDAALADHDPTEAARAVARCVGMLTELGVRPAPTTSALIRRVEARTVPAVA